MDAPYPNGMTALGISSELAVAARIMHHAPALNKLKQQAK
jgi:hypothetical protein